MTDTERKNQKKIYVNDHHEWFLDEEVQNNSKLFAQFLDQYILTDGDMEQTVSSVREMRLDSMVSTLMEAWETTFHQFESHRITITNPAVRNWSEQAGLSQDKFVEVMKHLSWQVGTVSRDDVAVLVNPDSDEAVVNPFDAERAVGRTES